MTWDNARAIACAVVIIAAVVAFFVPRVGPGCWGEILSCCRCRRRASPPTDERRWPVGMYDTLADAVVAAREIREDPMNFSSAPSMARLATIYELLPEGDRLRKVHSAALPGGVWAWATDRNALVMRDVGGAEPGGEGPDVGALLAAMPAVGVPRAVSGRQLLAAVGSRGGRRVAFDGDTPRVERAYEPVRIGGVEVNRALVADALHAAGIDERTYAVTVTRRRGTAVLCGARIAAGDALLFEVPCRRALVMGMDLGAMETARLLADEIPDFGEVVT